MHHALGMCSNVLSHFHSFFRGVKFFGKQWHMSRASAFQRYLAAGLSFDIRQDFCIAARVALKGAVIMHEWS